MEDRLRWDRRYAGMDAAAVPAPPDALRGREGLLPPGGRALDVACGRGGVAVWLAQRGFTVDAVDVSPVALRAGAALAAEHGVAQQVRFRCHDLDDGLPGDLDGDLGGGVAVLVCQLFRDPRLYPRLAGLLAPGGLLVLTVLSTVGDSGPFRAPAGELRTAFPGLRVLAHTEGGGRASLLAVAPARAADG